MLMHAATKRSSADRNICKPNIQQLERKEKVKSPPSSISLCGVSFHGRHRTRSTRGKLRRRKKKGIDSSSEGANAVQSQAGKFHYG